MPGPVRKGRVRTGCLTCRARKVKCGEERPACFNCTRLNRACFYEMSPTDYRHVMQSPSSGADKSATLTGISADHIDIFSQINMGASPNPIYGITQDLQASPGNLSASFDAVAGEWGEIFAADPYHALDTRISPQYSSEDILLDLPQVVGSMIRFEYFVSHVQPPFIVPWDEGNWINAKLEFVEMSAYSPPISAALAAVETLYEGLDGDGKTADTLPAYFTAKAAYTLAINDGQLNTDQLFVVTFLLCCCEVVAQQETVSSTLKQKDSLVAALEASVDQKPWSPLVQRIIIWMHLFHAKALHLGGRGILGPKVLSLLEDQQDVALCIRSRSSNTGVGRQALTQSLQQTLFGFYLELQRISILAASMNRHHRPRGAPADEILVDRLSGVISRRLENLWHGRPDILDCTVAELSRVLNCSSEDLAHTYLLSCLCRLCYNAEIVYYLRSQGRLNTDMQKIQAARESIRALIDEAHIGANGEALFRQPALIWPLFLYSVESGSEEEVSWALTKFGSIRSPLWHTEIIKTFVRELTEEQLRNGERVDSRFFCVEKYGFVPPFL